MKVKIIRAENTWELEKEINKFLSSMSDNQIIDIKYQGVGNHATYSTDRPSAMIILRGNYER